MVSKFYLGTQGWSYKDWVGSFYPAGSRPGDYLSIYARHFDAVELDTTFYGAPTQDRVDAWNRSTPDTFKFTAKVPRTITHDRHLVDVQDDFDDFLRALSGLGEKLGAILLQLPPDFVAEERPALEAFLKLLPSDMRFAIEFRHRSWLTEETLELLRSHNVAWTMIDLVYMPKRTDITADFSYVRWLGNRKQIEQFSQTQLDRSKRLDDWAEILDDVARHVQRVYGFANNHYSGHSPSDIRYLQHRLGMDSQPTAPDQFEQRTLL